MKVLIIFFYFRCIPQEYFCNGENNCMDGSDEIGCNTTQISQKCDFEFNFKCEDSGLCISR